MEVLSLGGGAQSTLNPGAALGAAFSSPTEGWLGAGVLPVHLTAAPATSRLTPWPVPIPPQPAGDRARARGAGGRARQRSPRRRPARCGGALQARPGLGSGKPARGRRNRQAPEPARGRLAEADARIRGWRRRADVALEGRDRRLGTRSRDPDQLQGRPARRRLRPERTVTRLRGRHERDRAGRNDPALRKELDRRNLAARRSAGRGSSWGSPSPARKRWSPSSSR